MPPTYYSRYGAKPRRKRGLKSVLFLLGIAFVGATYTISLLVWPLQTLQAESAELVPLPAQQVSVDWPDYGQSAVYAPGYGTLASNGSDKPVPMASITKIVTALTVLDSKPLPSGSEGERIAFTKADVATFNDYLARLGSVGPVTPGQKVSQKDMLDVMLGISANNYADKLAIWAFGSLDAYLTAANQFLADHNLHDTKVADASGFSPNSRSTANDLVRLGSLALAEPAIAEAVSARKVAVPGFGTVNSTNRLLQQDEDVLGIKTGTTDEAGSCLLYAKKYVLDGQELVIIGATLGAPNHVRLATDAANVLASTRTGFATATLAEEGYSFASYRTAWGDAINVVTAEEVRGIVWQGEEPTHDISVADISPRNIPNQVGTVTFTQGEQTISTASLVLERPLQSPDWWWRLLNPQAVIAG